MIFQVINFELQRQFKKLPVYVYFGITLALSFFIMNLAGGLFDEVQISFASDSGKIFLNSGPVIHRLISSFSTILTILVMVLAGGIAYKDFKDRSHAILFTTGMSKTNYLMGKFIAIFVSCMFVFSGVGIGFYLATFMPYLNQDLFMENHLMVYVQPYLTQVVFNLFFQITVFFSVTVLTRNFNANYVLLVLLYALFSVAGRYLGDVEMKDLASILDPLGGIARDRQSEYWSPEEYNDQLYHLTGWFLWNRLLWFGIAFVGLVYSFNRFTFTQEVRAFRFGKKKNKRTKSPGQTASAIVYKKMQLSPVDIQHKGAIERTQLLFLLKYYFKVVVRKPYFLLLMLLMIIMVISSMESIGTLYGTTTYLSTSQVISFLFGLFSTFIYIFTILMSADVLFREKDTRMSLFTDAMPVSNRVLLLSKFSTIAVVQFLLLLLVMVCGILIQASDQYYKFEIGLYLQDLFTIRYVDMLLFSAFCFMIHVLVNHKYLGIFIIVAYYFFMETLGGALFDHNLFIYGSDPGVAYSDLNGFGHFLYPFYVYKSLWGLVAILFFNIGSFLFPRGVETKLKTRWNEGIAGLRKAQTLKLSGLLALIVLMMGFIVYNTNVLNENVSGYDAELIAVDYELQYKKYEHNAQPKIVDVNVNVDLYPSDYKIHANGSYTLKNKTNTAIDSIHIQVNNDDAKFDFEGGATLVSSDTRIDYYIYELKQPLSPGDSLDMHFELAYEREGFTMRTTTAGAIDNGTFINNMSYLPSIGYEPSGEISLNKTRKKHNLPEKLSSKRIDDPIYSKIGFFGKSSDFIRFQATVSTENDQVAIAPGYLTKEWEENNRRYFHYEMDQPILNFYSFNSGRYMIHKDNWKDVAIQIYYHKGHDYNLERMTSAIKESLDYYTEVFGAYPHRQVRIIEFPRYATFAQSFPNTIPFSEAIGFIAKVDAAKVNSLDTNEESAVEFDAFDIDYPFYVTAHEMAHQWWPHQFMGAAVEGGNSLSETLAQYSALMVMRHHYGEEMMTKFLKYEQDRYLSARSGEEEDERPIHRCDDGQQHILYNKGGNVMYALAQYIGEREINHALSAFLNERKMKSDSYATTKDLMRHLQAHTPDSLQHLLTDWLDEVTFYAHKVYDASYDRNEDFEYKLNFMLDAKKTQLNEEGIEVEVTHNDPVEIIVYHNKGHILYNKMHYLEEGTNEIELTLERRPETVKVDPRLLLIDKNLMNNSVACKKKEEET